MLSARSLAAILFPILLATLVITNHAGVDGALGPHSDDLSSNMRDPVTGEAPTPFNPYAPGWFNYFWRPLHIAMCLGVSTYAHAHWWLVSIACSMVHLWASWSVFRLLSLSTRSTLPAGAAALLFMLHPMQYEVVYWLCTISTAIATGLFCTLARWQFGWMAAARSRASWFLITATIGLAIPSFYEQPAAGVAVMPLVLAAGWLRAQRDAGASPSVGRDQPRDDRESGAPPGPAAALRRGVALVAVWGLMNLVYLALMMRTMPRDRRGGSGSFVSADQAAARAGEIARAVRYNLYGVRIREVFHGSVELGWSVLNTPVGLALLAALALSALAWVAWSARSAQAAWGSPDGRAPAGRSAGPSGEPGGTPASAGPGAPERWIWVVAGVGLFLASLLPVAVVSGQKLEARNLYVPLLGLAVLLAQTLDVSLACLARLPRARLALGGLIGLAAAAACLIFSISHIGSQEGFRLVHRFDTSVSRQLRELVPDPPPKAIFMPVRVSDDGAPIQTGYATFDHARPHLFSAIWAGHALVQQTYRRNDAWIVSWSPWAGLGAHAFTPDGFTAGWRRANVVAKFGDREHITWDRAVPFVVEAGGAVRLVRRLVAESPTGEAAQIDPPVVAAMLADPVASGRIGPTRVVRIQDRVPVLPSAWLEGWRWPDGSSVQWTDVRIWGVGAPAAWMHARHDAPADPATEAPGARGPRSSMTLVLPPSEHPRRLVFRVTIGGDKLRQARRSGSVTLTWSDQTRAVPLASLTLTDAWVRRHRRWAGVSFDVPASAEPIELRCDVRTRARAYFHDVWVTPGAIGRADLPPMRSDGVRPRGVGEAEPIIDEQPEPAPMDARELELNPAGSP